MSDVKLNSAKVSDSWFVSVNWVNISNINDLSLFVVKLSLDPNSVCYIETVRDRLL